MNQTDNSKNIQVENEKEKKDVRSHSVADYLQAPRRKKRSYVITALSGKTLQFQAGIEAFVKAQSPSVNVGHAKNEEELKRYFRRQVLLVVIDDEFLDRDKVMDLALICKLERSEKNTPFLFLTKDPNTLIHLYREKMEIFHEGDEYINYMRSSQTLINSRLKYGLSNQFRRKSRRYGNQIHVSYFLINDDTKRLGMTSDISLNGCYLETRDEHVFKIGEQLNLHIHLPYLSPSKKGEFLHIACRVRRLSISGNGAGISFEHLSEGQKRVILEFVTFLAKRSIVRPQSEGKLRVGSS